MKKVLSILLAVVLVFGMLPASALTVFAADSYEKATSIAVGDTVVLVYETGKMELSSISTTSTKYGVGVAYSSAPTGAMPLTVVEGSTSGTFAFKTGDKYLYWTSGNSLNVDATLSAKTSWTVTFDSSGNAVIANANTSTRTIRWNTSSPRFACYTSGQAAVQLYKLNTSACDHVNKISNNDAVAPTCTEPGKTDSYYCPDCTGTIDAEAIDPLGHSYVDGICSVCGEEEPDGYVLTDIANIKATDVVIITATKGGKVYAMSNDKGTASGPAPVEVEVSDNTITDAADNILWNVGGSADAYIFYPNGTTATWLYCTGTNNGVRVGTNTDNTFKIDASSGYLKHNGTSRYLGVYNTQDWRCYTSSTATNIKDQTFAFYVQSAGDSGCEECVPGTPVKEKEVAATCTKEGSYESVTYCTECGNVITRETVTVSMIDHVYENGACTSCGKVDPSVETKAELMTTLPGDGDKIIVYYPVDKKAMGTSNAVSTEPVDTLLPYNTAVAVLTVELDGENYALKLSDGTYLATGATGGDLTFLTEVSELAQWTVETAGNNLWYITNVGAAYNSNKQALEYYGGAFKTWTKGEGAEFQMALYLVEKGEDACPHTNTQEQSDGYAAKCGVPGMTNSVKCLDCGITTKSQEEIPALEHNYVDYVCTLCGDEQKIGNYVRVSDIADITDGQYVIVAEVDGKFYALDTKTSGKFEAVEVEISNNTVTTVGAPIWTATAVNGNITLQTGESYLGWKSSTDFSAVDGYEWVVEAGDNNTFNFTASTTVSESTKRGIFYRTGTVNKFGAYATSNSSQTDEYYWDLQLYKYVQPVAAYKDGAWVGYNTVAKALENSDQIKLYANVDSISYSGDLYLDLNGFDVTSADVSGTIYAYNSSASAAAAGTGRITTSSEVVMDNTVNNVRYIALAEGEEEIKTYTFHVLEMKLSAVTLRANEECGIYYKATYACDDTLKNAIDSYGVVFSLQDMPGADFKTEANGRNLYTVYEKDSFVSGAEVTSGSIFGIMKDTEDRAALAAEQGKTLAQLNAEYGQKDIHANAYIVINGETLVGTGASYSLFDVMDKLDEKWNDLTDAQRTTIQTFYDFWASKGMSDWAAELPNIAG